MTVNGQEVLITLYDTPTANVLYAELPMIWIFRIITAPRRSPIRPKLSRQRGRRTAVPPMWAICTSMRLGAISASSARIFAIRSCWLSSVMQSQVWKCWPLQTVILRSHSKGCTNMEYAKSGKTDIEVSKVCVLLIPEQNCCHFCFPRFLNCFAFPASDFFKSFSCWRYAFRCFSFRIRYAIFFRRFSVLFGWFFDNKSV